MATTVSVRGPKSYHAFKLLTFTTSDVKKQFEDNEAENELEDEEDDEPQKANAKAKPKPHQYTVQFFGISEKGKTACIYVEGYQPFFYVKVPQKWGQTECNEFEKYLKQLLEKDAEEIASTELVQHKKLYGFDAGALHNFVRINFHSERTMMKAKKFWYTKGANRKLIALSFMNAGLELYEAQIPPLLRLFHIRSISPSGWIMCLLSKLRPVDKRQTTCAYEFAIDFKDLHALASKETAVPYKICSFDIEASSSHGDFPLPKKEYTKLATNIVDVCRDQAITHEFLERCIMTAFGHATQPVEDVALVYLKTPITKARASTLCQQWLTRQHWKETDMQIDDTNEHELEEAEELDLPEPELEQPEQDEDEADENDGEEQNDGEEAAATNFWAQKATKVEQYTVASATVVTMLQDANASRDAKIAALNQSLVRTFPPVLGDNVTFIGSTFMRYGESKPYLNHCLVKGTCDDLPNAVIQCCDTERDVILEWAKLIQREDPDIIIGYNIFGFDYNFMYERAKELDCAAAFLKLSRKKGEVCESYDWKTKTSGLETSTIVLASGQYDLKYAKMTGRVQVDMYCYLRREYQLSQYKLDYVAGYFIGDEVQRVVHALDESLTLIYSKNLKGLEVGSYVSFQVEHYSADPYEDGAKFLVTRIDTEDSCFFVQGHVDPDMTKSIKWGLAKDDVTPQDIFRMTNEGPAERATIAKYCIQDCNLVHNLFKKIDVLTGYVEMANLCSVPIDFLVFRGQGIKLTSYVAKKCREKNTLLPVLDRVSDNGGYEGATVLEPKCNLYLEDPVACVDYSSLYPSSMMSENISHDSKVWTKSYTLDGRLTGQTGVRDRQGNYIYDNLPQYRYVDITYNLYEWQLKNKANLRSGKEKVKVGYKICRFAQFPDDPKTGDTTRAIMPSILQELLAARAATRKLIKTEKDEFMKNVLDKRQLSIKVTANSLYGQTGAKTSSFYEKDCAASTTAMGRKFLTYGKRVIEEAYKDRVCDTKDHGKVRTNAEYVYGDTDSVFFKFNLTDLEGNKIGGQKALAITIELAQQAGNLATTFLKYPHDLEYEKTFLPFCLLSKKRYVGILYENKPEEGECKAMGIVLKRRDNAPIVKDIYGGVIDILMEEKNVTMAVQFMQEMLKKLINHQVPIEKLVITKSLRGHYKNPQQIAHRVLADRMGQRDPGNKPGVGDRIPFVFIENKAKGALQGDRIETPTYVQANKLHINYGHYITNQIMKPLQQLFGLVLEQTKEFQAVHQSGRKWRVTIEQACKECATEDAYRKKKEQLRLKEVKALLFEPTLRELTRLREGNQDMRSFFGKAPSSATGASTGPSTGTSTGPSTGTSTGPSTGKSLLPSPDGKASIFQHPIMANKRPFLPEPDIDVSANGMTSAAYLEPKKAKKVVTKKAKVVTAENLFDRKPSTRRRR